WNMTSTGTLVIGAAATLNITPSATYNMNDHNLVNNGTAALTSVTLNGTGLFTNTGMLTLRGSTVNAPLVNQGTITALGTNTPNAINGTFTSQAGSTVRVESNATSQNASLTFAAGFTNNGLIEVVSLDAGFASNFNVTNGVLV